MPGELLYLLEREPDMTRDLLFLLKTDFEDPAYPGQRFYCLVDAMGYLGRTPSRVGRWH